MVVPIVCTCAPGFYSNGISERETERQRESGSEREREKVSEKGRGRGSGREREGEELEEERDSLRPSHRGTQRGGTKTEAWVSQTQRQRHKGGPGRQRQEQ